MVRRVEPNPSDEEETRRLVSLRTAISGDSQTAFAARIGIEVRRWNNFERGLPLSKEVGLLLCEKIQGVTLDWLFRGKLDAVPLALREALESAGNGQRCSSPDVGANGGPYPFADQGRRLRWLRQAERFETAAAFGKSLRWPQSGVSQFEIGMRRVPTDKALQLREKIPGFDPTWLWTGDKSGLAFDLRQRIEAEEAKERE
jgi:hypothetical protein